MMRATIMLLMMTMMNMMITWTERWQDFSGPALPQSYFQPTFNEMMIMPKVMMMMVMICTFEHECERIIEEEKQ